MAARWTMVIVALIAAGCVAQQPDAEPVVERVVGDSGDEQRRRERQWYRDQIAAGRCLDVDDDLVDVLQAGLREPLTVHVRGATRSRVHDGRYYLAVDLDRPDGTRETSTPTFVADAITGAVTTVGAISSSAQRYTTFADASDIGGAEFDENVTGLIPSPIVHQDPDLLLAEQWCGLPADAPQLRDGF